MLNALQFIEHAEQYSTKRSFTTPLTLAVK